MIHMTDRGRILHRKLSSIARKQQQTLMDRLDGFLVAALAAVLIGIVRQGTEAPAQGLLVW